MKVKVICLLLAGVVIAACGGGGGGGITTPKVATVVGKVVDVSTGGAPNPQASVQAGSASTLTASVDGSFNLVVPEGTTEISIDPRNGEPVFRFTFPAATGLVDVGDIWVGPAKVRLDGRTISVADSTPVSGARISFAGRSGLTGADGKFSLADVAYDPANHAFFWAITGLAEAPGFIPNQFTVEPNVAVGGVVTMSDLALIPEGDDEPPPGPVNIWGRVSPADQAAGTVVTLKQAGDTVRSYTVDASATYGFWVTPGTYTMSFAKGALTAPDETVTLNNQTEVVRRDVTLR